MIMHNPPHPGEFINDVFLEPNGISGRALAETVNGGAQGESPPIVAGFSRRPVSYTHLDVYKRQT